MSIILRSDTTRPISFDDLDGNINRLKHNRWVLGSYNKGEFVIYKESDLELELYSCVTSHTEIVYTGNTFSKTYGDITLWETVSSTTHIESFGSSGTAGSSGDSGTSGQSKLSGSSGSSGESGTFGSSGSSGTSGTYGTAGLTGVYGTNGFTPNTLWLSTGNTFGYTMTGGTLDNYDVNLVVYSGSNPNHTLSFVLTNNHRGTIRMNGIGLSGATSGITSPGIQFSNQYVSGVTRGYVTDSYDGQAPGAFDNISFGVRSVNNYINIRTNQNHINFFNNNIYGFDNLRYIRTTSSTNGSLRVLIQNGSSVTTTATTRYVLGKFSTHNEMPINPSGGTADWTLSKFNMNINESGTPTGLKRSILIEPTLTSLLSGYRSIVDRSDHELAYSYYQTGPLTKNFFNGKVLIGASGDTGYNSMLQVTGDIELTTVGNSLKIKSNTTVNTGTTISPANQGQIYLSGGLGKVTRPIDPDDFVFLTRNTYRTTTSTPYISDLSFRYASDNASFFISSQDTGETSLVNYLIVKRTI
jgi:hypothetical protein